LQTNEIEQQHQLVQFSTDDLRKKSEIYHCTNPTRYQQSINDAAFELCKGDPVLVLSKGKLFEEARKKVDSAGYGYVKKVSRSNVYGTESQPRKSKRKYIAAEIRASRFKELSDSISSLSETIELLTKQKQQYSNAEKFLQAAQINSSILEKGKEKWKLEKEMKMLSKAESKSKSSAKKKCKQQKRNEKQSSVNVSPSGIDMYVTSSPPSTDVQSSDPNENDTDERPWPLLREDATVGMTTNTHTSSVSPPSTIVEGDSDFQKSPK
jgi:hypothetical protein